MTEAIRLLEGDCRAILRGLDADSVDSIVTDPPYELGFMGKAWDATGIANDPAMWREALRVLNPGGHLVAFSGSRTYHRMVCAIEDAGFEIRDQLQWIYGSGFPKSHNIGNGWGTALKPAHEPIVLARKPLIGTVAANVLAHGTGALNIDGARVNTAPRNPGFKNPADSRRDMMATSNAKLVGYESPSGRWPANVIHDGSDEVLEAFAAFGEKPGAVSNGSKTQKGLAGSDTFKIRERPQAPGRGDSGTAARFFYCAKASRADRGEGNIHPTVKPRALMAYLCKLVTPPGGTVLDPFTGSGSTGIGAVMGGFQFIGCDLQPEYLAIAERRIAAAQPTAPDLFGVAAE